MRRGMAIGYNDVAAWLAHEDAAIQAEFLDTFAKELVRCCETSYHAEVQMDRVNRKVKPETRSLLELLSERLGQ